MRRGLCEKEMADINWSDVEEVEARAGVYRKSLTLGGIQIVMYRYLPGSIFEEHSHPEEQLTIGERGSLEFTVGGRRSMFRSGDIVHIPSDVPHGAVNRGEEEAVTLNIYHPARRAAP